MLRRTAFKIKPRKPLKRTPLRKIGRSETAVNKEKVQYLLRQICLKRDTVCLLSNYPETGRCGPLKADGKPVYQAEHLNSRSHAVSFGDSRNTILLCQRHHIYWKPQNSARYWEIVEEMIGPKRWELVHSWIHDRIAHKQDLKLDIIALEQELKQYV